MCVRGECMCVRERIVEKEVSIVEKEVHCFMRCDWLKNSSRRVTFRLGLPWKVQRSPERFSKASGSLDICHPQKRSHA